MGKIARNGGPSVKILYLRNHRSSSCRAKLDGVLRYARARAWEVQVLDIADGMPLLRKTAAEFDAAGCLFDANVEDKVPKPGWFKGVPTVLLDYSSSAAIPPGCGAMRHDSLATARLAARNLLALDCSCYAFVPHVYPRRSWSDIRRDAFVSAVESAGMECRVFAASSSLRTPAEFHRALCPWIKTLPKRCGIFAANDEMGEMVLSVCRKLEVSVPREVAVIGVDNDGRICENSVPTLSSIQIDFERGGYLAAEMLDGLVSGDGPVARSGTFGPMGVIWRQSLRIFKAESPKIDAAVEHIRLHACEGLRARDVAARIGGSRRLAEIRFREATGHSILEEIHRVRFERLFNLLRRPTCKIDAVAGLCGYESIETLRRLFRRKTGTTMREWRRKNALPKCLPPA